MKAETREVDKTYTITWECKERLHRVAYALGELESCLKDGSGQGASPEALIGLLADEMRVLAQSVEELGESDDEADAV